MFRVASCPKSGHGSPVGNAVQRRWAALSTAKKLLVVLGALVVASALVAPQGGTDAKPAAAVAPAKPTLKHAQSAARIHVRRILKAPDSAEFGYAEQCTEAGDAWTCTGWVQAQNALGVLLKQTFTVKLRFVGGDPSEVGSWEAVEGPTLF